MGGITQPFEHKFHDVRGTKTSDVAGQLHHVGCASSFELIGSSCLSGAARRRTEDNRGGRDVAARSKFLRLRQDSSMQWNPTNQPACVTDQQPIYSVGSTCSPEQLASSRLCGSRVNCLVDVVQSLFGRDWLEFRTCPVRAVKRTSYGYSYRARWWDSMSARLIGAADESQRDTMGLWTGCNSRSIHIMLVPHSPGEYGILSVVCSH